MKIRLYKFSKRDNSTKQPSASDSYVEKNVALKDDTDIKTPSFELHTTDATYTYAYIPDWNRYYFVSDVTYINNSEIIYHLEEDVLASNKTAIGNTVAHIAYSSTGWDKDIVDSRCAVLSNKITRSKNSSDTHFDTTGCFLLSIVGTETSANGFATTYVCDNSKLFQVAQTLMGLDIQQRVIKSVYAPFDCVISCTWIPVKYSTITSTYCRISSFVFGDWDSNIEGFVLTGTQMLGDGSVSLTPTYNDFRAIQPYSSYTLTIPFYGNVDLNASDIKEHLLGGSLPVAYTIDIASAEMTVMIGANPIMQTITCNIGVNCPIAQTSTNMTGTIGTIGGTIGGIAGTAIGIATGNAPLGITSGITALTSASTTALSANARATSIKGGINGRSSAIFGTKFQLNEYAMETEDCDSANYIAKWGRPVGVTHAINNHSGYVQCDDASIAIDGDSFERAQINGYLNSGFYYE